MLSDKLRHFLTGPPPAVEAAPARISFDPLDGKKRVLITIGTDGNFEPVAWYGLPYGLAEASNIAAHGALILTECVWQESVKAAAATPAGEVVTNGD